MHTYPPDDSSTFQPDERTRNRKRRTAAGHTWMKMRMRKQIKIYIQVHTG